MSSEIRNIALSFPCRENWEQFEVVAGGRLCNSCAHVVRDFRDCTMVELTTAMKASPRVCGRFSADQLSASFLKVAVVALAAGALAGCEPAAPAPEVTGRIMIGMPVFHQGDSIEVVSVDTLDLLPGDKLVPVSLTHIK